MTSDKSRAIRLTLSVAAFVSGMTLLGANIALAGSCPADKMMTDATKSVSFKPSGVTDKVLTTIDLSKESLKADGRKFRLRKLEVQPGGIVPWHSHEDRPALIYIVSGTITEYASNCAVPIVHKAGEAAGESRGLAHYWKNTGNSVVVLISADILNEPVEKDPKMM
jgi:quercetin dioxygenase-like cupin family protein